MGASIHSKPKEGLLKEIYKENQVDSKTSLQEPRADKNWFLKLLSQKYMLHIHHPNDPKPSSAPVSDYAQNPQPQFLKPYTN